MRQVAIPSHRRSPQERLLPLPDVPTELGSASRRLGHVPRHGFSWIAGTPGTYASSARAKRQFCAACGSYLIFRSEDSPAEVSINTASLDDPDAFPPTMHRPEVKVASSVPGRLRSKNHEPCVYATAARRKATEHTAPSSGSSGA